jgi:uncharacterized protein YkwD
MRKIYFVLLVFILPLFAIAANDGAAPAEGVTALPCYDMDAEACHAFYLTNSQRAENGQAPMEYCQECFVMAQDQSDDMKARGYFSHTRPNGETFMQRANRFGIKNWAGENIAMNKSAANAVARLMKSPGHRKNILNPKYNAFAVGHRDGLYTQVFWKRPAPAAPAQ